MANKAIYPGHLLERAKSEKWFGRMNDPTSSAYIRGACGDEMEFYLVIEDKIIQDIHFYTEGCMATRVCGSMTAQLSSGKSIDHALELSPKNVVDALPGLFDEDHHCAILAVTTLYKAIADYLLRP